MMKIEKSQIAKKSFKVVENLEKHDEEVNFLFLFLIFWFKNFFVKNLKS